MIDFQALWWESGPGIGRVWRHTPTRATFLYADQDVAEPLTIRGYTLEKLGQRELAFHTSGTYVVDDSKQCSLL